MKSQNESSNEKNKYFPSSANLITFSFNLSVPVPTTQTALIHANQPQLIQLVPTQR